MSAGYANCFASHLGPASTATVEYSTMERREFLGGTITATLLSADPKSKPPAKSAAMSALNAETTAGGPTPEIERAQVGKPHAGKVLATIAPHSDDHSILCRRHRRQADQ